MEDIALESDVSQWVTVDHDDSSLELNGSSLMDTSDVSFTDSPVVTPASRPAPPATPTTNKASSVENQGSVWGFWTRLGDDIGKSVSALGTAIEEKTGIAGKVAGTIDSIDDKLAISATVDGLAQKVNVVLEKPTVPPGFKKIGQCDDGDPYKNPLIDDDELQYL